MYVGSGKSRPGIQLMPRRAGVEGSKENKEDVVTWNDGCCAVPYCEYCHICAKCAGEHKVIHCKTYPPLKLTSQSPKGVRKV